jgi:carbon storage regulator
MLILGRFKSESILVGDDVEIFIVDISPGGKVRLGIDAPREVPVHRREIYDKLHQQPPDNEGGDRK